MLFNSTYTVSNQIRIGTRASRLAKRQAQEVKKEFIFKLGWDERDIILSEFTTTGDRVYDRPFRMIGDKGVFCKEIETAILAEKIDGGVHSLKDMPLDQPEGLVIAAYFKRENPYDTLITHKAKSIKDLPSNSSIGTSSIRRKLQIQRENKHINVIPIRGNIHTRLGIWKEGKVDGLVLASAGLNRMKFLGLPRYTVSDSILLPSPGQGTICFECRTYDKRIIEIVKRVSHKETEIAAKAERSFLASLGGDCDLPVGGLAIVKNNSVYLKGEFYSDKLERFIHGSRESEDVHAVDSGKILADSLLEEETRSLALT